LQNSVNEISNSVVVPKEMFEDMMARLARFEKEKAPSLDRHQESRQASRIQQQIEQSEEYTEAGECEHPRTLATCLKYINLVDSATRKRKLAPYKQEETAVSQWSEFYNRARAYRNKLSKMRRAKIETIFQMIEKEEHYSIPKDGDPTLDAACEALDNALQNASKTDVEHDTAEINKALDNLQRAYNEAAKSNTVFMRYIDVEPPCSPYSPLEDESLNGILLARSWMRELITRIHNQSLARRTLVIGNPGSGEFLGLSFL
jgi:hypothetical protein